MIVYCTSTTQPMKSIRAHARERVREYGTGLARYIEFKPHLNPKEQLAAMQNILDEYPRKDSATIPANIIASTYELPILRVMREIREKRFDHNNFRVDCLIVPIGLQLPERKYEVVRLRANEEGEFLDRWPEGFFDESMGELF